MMTTPRFNFLSLICLIGTLIGCQGESAEPPGNSAAAAVETVAQPNPLQTQTDALQKAKELGADVEAAERKRREELDRMTDG